MDRIRTIKLFKNYYKDFYVAQTQTVRDKINFVLKVVETQKTPLKEIKRAEAIRKEYLKSKEAQ